MDKLIKSNIDEELEKGIELLDQVDAYKWALICSEHALTMFELKNKKSIDKALQTINNNLDNVSADMAKTITSTILTEANSLKNVDTALHYMMLSLAHTVATLVNKSHTIYAAIYAGCAILNKTNDNELYKTEKLYQLEKLEKFLIMYQS